MVPGGLGAWGDLLNLRQAGVDVSNSEQLLLLLPPVLVLINSFRCLSNDEQLLLPLE
jgi:hypothetical protein